MMFPWRQWHALPFLPYLANYCEASCLPPVCFELQLQLHEHIIFYRQFLKPQIDVGLPPACMVMADLRVAVAEYLLWLLLSLHRLLATSMQKLFSARISNGGILA